MKKLLETVVTAFIIVEVAPKVIGGALILLEVGAKALNSTYQNMTHYKIVKVDKERA